LTPWEGSVKRCGGRATSAGGEVAPERGKGGDDAADADLTRPKNEKKITWSIQLIQIDDEDLKQ
jgi:hypothetical protein